ncbi:BZ3500_MvSof-1268-A1-R1_Chr6-3g08865 [Microbotryum saponariae]|uniref:BZ3500_MvSof-1268-A1-R1_Chr6-3g08865 protein n=1 Tax=Microbotryum saponariae TaxID=289078 RepID=A0A2X0NMQ4_9BASI|nr:BZ3500_MvSof-1268-A1-R1_Chr6-3g08865 [Microbotryum saponariae]SDA07466.1 BZ3501_MvSof-1269-A2-R1_Chr6-2g08568 [Microbotryum saponariae]
MRIHSTLQSLWLFSLLLSSTAAQIAAPPSYDLVARAAADASDRNAFKRHVQGVLSHVGFKRHKRHPVAELAATSAIVRRDNSSSSYGNSQAISSTTKSNSTSSTSASKALNGYWYGASSYYLYSIAVADRIAILDTLQKNGFKVVRIFIAYVGANNKGSNNREVQDRKFRSLMEYHGSLLDRSSPRRSAPTTTRLLAMIDQLMLECKARGLKLLISMSDRYQLGFWGTDAYATQLDIVKAGSSGVQKVADASAFYTSAWASTALDNRITHILNHKNALMGNQSWANLDEVIYAFEAQNEPMGHMALASPTWVCDRSATIKKLLPSGSSIQVSSGGGITTQASLGGWATSCASIDIISVHDYGTNAQATANALKAAKAANPDKTVMMGEWGVAGGQKASTIAAFVSAFKSAGLPWMYWEIVKPGQGPADFEVWTNEGAWGALVGASYSNDPVTATTAAAARATSQPATTQAAQAQSTKSQQTQTHASASPSAGGNNGQSKAASSVRTSGHASAAAATKSASNKGGNKADASSSR